MVAVCERDCHGPAKLEDIPFGAGERTNRGDIANMKWQMFVRGQEYDIDTFVLAGNDKFKEHKPVQSMRGDRSGLP